MTGIFFKSAAHPERLLTAMQGIGKIYDGKLDNEYAAALYILTADAATWSKASDYVSRRGIRFADLLEEADFSHGHLLLVKLAANLFFSRDLTAHTLEHAPEVVVGPVDLVRTLDETNFKLALSAIQLRRYSAHVDDLTF